MSVSIVETRVFVTGDQSADIVTVGTQGAAGVGVPAGGVAGQVLEKIDSADYNTRWTDIRSYIRRMAVAL